MPSTPVERFLSQLQAVREAGNGWTARCPAHEDRNNSLSIAEGEDGRALLKCFAGCDLEQILAALGLELSDLFLADRSHTVQAAPPRNRGGAITVEELAGDKAIPSEFLRQLGLTERNDGVIIPYTLQDGSSAPRQRLRTSLRAKDGSVWLFGKGSPVPYGLNRLDDARRAGHLMLVEGESDCWTAWLHSIPALGIPGATMARVLEAAYLAGITRIFVVKEPDKGGDAFVSGLSRRCRKVGWAGEILVLTPPPGFKDLNDLHKHDSTAFENVFRKMVEAAEPLAEVATDSPAAAADGEPRRREPTQAESLVRLADSAELFHDANGDAYATFEVGNHRETYPVRSRAFRRYIVHEYYQIHGKPPGTQSIQNSLAALEARAAYDGPRLTVFTRVAEHQGGIYLDLGNATWEVAEITATSWRVVSDCPVRFRRTKGMGALPHPARGGSVSDLRSFVNLENENDWHLLVAWLVAALRPRGPYPVIVLNGEHGSAKSTAAKITRNLCDPSTSPLRAEPREVRDLMIAAANSWCLCFDNISHLPPWLSDAICRLATGGGFSTRLLYENDEEIIFDAQRPVSLNGIEEIAARGDLLDRSLLITLPEITDDRRRDEQRFWAEFEAARPGILGALLDAVSAGLRNLPSVSLARTPRMADFARWATAAEPALGWEDGAFLHSYAGNRDSVNELALEASPIATEVRGLGEFCGTAAELLERLNERASEAVRKQPGWPRTARGLSGALRRSTPNLRRAGIEITFAREATATRRRLITIAQTADPTVQTVQTDHARQDPAVSLDGSSPSGHEAGRSGPSGDARQPGLLDGLDDVDGCFPPSYDDVR